MKCLAYELFGLGALTDEVVAQVDRVDLVGFEAIPYPAVRAGKMVFRSSFLINRSNTLQIELENQLKFTGRNEDLLTCKVFHTVGDDQGSSITMSGDLFACQ